VPVEVQTAGGSISKLVCEPSRPDGRRVRRHRSARRLSARRRGVRWARQRKGPASCTRTARGRTRTRSRRRARVPDRRGAHRAGAQGRAVRTRKLLLDVEAATEEELRALEKEVQKEVADAGDRGARPVPSPTRPPRRAISTRRRSIRPARTSTPRTAPTTASGATSPWSTSSTRASRTRWSATRASSCSARTSPTRRARRCSSSAPARAASSRSPTACSRSSGRARVQHAARRSEHRRDARSAWRCAGCGRSSRSSSSTTSGRRSTRSGTSSRRCAIARNGTFGAPS
jgi:hypothetical protein